MCLLYVCAMHMCVYMCNQTENEATTHITDIHIHGSGLLKDVESAFQNFIIRLTLQQFSTENKMKFQLETNSNPIQFWQKKKKKRRRIATVIWLSD